MKKSGSKRELDFEVSFEECVEESAKRRLRADQVKALERSFEAENKLEPERKVQLAMELGLDPRQVAIWFQNRRARWKTKQLERDYVLLQSAYDDLKQSYDAVKRENETLIQQIVEMKANGGLGFNLNHETAFYSDMNVVSADSATSGVQSEEKCVSSSEMLGNEDGQRLAIWPATYGFLADEETDPVFNWYCCPDQIRDGGIDG